MSQDWGNLDWVDDSLGLGDDDDDEEYESHSIQPFQCLAHQSNAETDLLETASGRGSNFNEDAYTGEGFDGLLEGLDLDDDDALSNSGTTLGRTMSVSMHSDPPQCKLDLIDTIFGSELESSGMNPSHTIHTPLEISNAGGSSTWQETNHSGGTYLNPQPPTSKSSAANLSRYSDSGWETVPSTPLADDFDLRPMPDHNSASMQGYNNPHTGIWSQDVVYEHYPPYMVPEDIYNDVSSTTRVRSLPQGLQEVIANAENATPFVLGFHHVRDVLPMNADLGADEGAGTTFPSVAEPSASRGPVPRFSPPAPYGQSGVINVTNGTPDFAASHGQEPPDVERSSLPPCSIQKSLPRLAPRILLNNSPVPASDLAQLPILAPRPRVPAAITPTTGANRCPYGGCQKNFSNTDTLRRHKNIVHSNKPPLVCPVCDLEFPGRRPDNVKRHFKIIHPDHLLPPWLKVRVRTPTRRSRVARS